MKIFVCDNDFESMMSCIYDVWAARYGSANVYLTADPDPQESFLDERIYVNKDDEKAEKVIRSIREKISFEAYRQIYLAAMTTEKDRVDCIYRFLRAGFAFGPGVTRMMTEPSVMRLFELSRRASNELHYFREFVRFSRTAQGVYVSHIEPICNVAAMVADHFADRMPSEHWLIIDDQRRLCVVHPKDQPFYVTELSADEVEFLKRSEEIEDPYVQLWKEFFQAIGIKERKNPLCQRNLFPLRYRKHVTEFLS